MIYELIIISSVHIRSYKDVVVIILEKHIQLNSRCYKYDPRNAKNKREGNLA